MAAPSGPAEPAFAAWRSSASYSGKLFDTGAQVGVGNASVKKLAASMRGNRVIGAVMYFSIDAEPFDDQWKGLQYTRSMVRALPGRVTPFLHQAEGASEIVPGDPLVAEYQTSLKLSQASLGRGIVRGIGELDIFGWNGGRSEAPPGPNEDPGMSPADPRLHSLVRVAAASNLRVMLHPNAGDAQSVSTLLEAFPSTTFIVHQFPEQFDADREIWLSLMSRYPNLFFAVNADHMLFDGESDPAIGLLYRYQDTSLDEAVSRALADFERDGDRLLQTAIRRYRAAIESRPDRFFWGSEAGTRYAFEPRVYDRWIAFSRHFIGSLTASVQKRFAYRNALRVLGKGARLTR